MAETDRLELEIATKIDKRGAEKVAALAKAIRSLNNAVKHFDTTNFSTVVNQMSDNLKDFLATVKKSQTGLSALATILKKASPKKATKKAAKLGELGTETIDTGDEVATTPAPKIKLVDNMGVARQINLFDSLTNSIKGTNKETKKFINLRKTKIDKFGNALARIELYRAIRAILKDVGETVKSTFDYASSKFPEFNQTLSQFTSSTTIITSSIGQILVALLPAIVPILQIAATLIANIANVIMKMSAALRGSNKYMKINTEYFKDQKEAAQGTLLAFDTFTTLAVNNTFNPDDIFSEEEMSPEEMEKTKKSALTILATLRNIVALLIAAKLAKGALKVFDAVDKIKKSLGGVSENVKGVNSLLGKTPSKAEKIQTKLFDVAMVAAVLLATFTSFSNLFDVIDNWDEKTLVQKITAIASAIAATVGLIAAGMALLNPTMAGIKTVKAVAVGASLTSMFLTAVSTSKFADGGMFEGAGTMYAIAGESGAEVVAKGSQGTGVLNVEQFKTAMVQAFYEYGAARGDLSAASVTLNGEKVGKMTASSSYREMVRQGLL